LNFFFELLIFFLNFQAIISFDRSLISEQS